MQQTSARRAGPVDVGSDFQIAINKALSEPAFARFAQYKADLLENATFSEDGDLRVALVTLERSRIMALRSQDAFTSWHMFGFGAAVAGLALGVVLLLCDWLHVPYNLSYNLEPVSLRWSYWLLMAVSLASIALLAWSIRRRREVIARAEDDYLIRHNAYLSIVSEIARSALSRAVNNVLGPRGLVPFPTEAPRLVELDVAQSVPSRTFDFVESFIGGHVTSAIGIAGPRGSGKSTIMQALHATHLSEGTSIFVDAPVAYHGDEFLRSLYARVAREVLVQEGLTRIADSYRRALRLLLDGRTLFGLALMIIGLAIAFGRYLASSIFLTQYGVLVTGLAIAAIGYLIGLSNITQALAIRTRSRSVSTVSLARTALEDLRYEVENTTTNRFTFGRSGVKAEGESAERRLRRSLSGAEVSNGLKTLLTSISQSSDRGRVFIFIDELDKMADAESAISLINSLKDFFHLRGVHFVVSVSEEALENFEARGYRARDAFDSSFDTIIPTLPLTATESRDVVATRAEGFPPIVTLLCHAWSGGLPRDVLRYARRLVELNNEVGEPIPVLELMRRFASQELALSMDAELNGLLDAASATCLLEARDLIRSRQNGEALAMVELRALCEAPLDNRRAGKILFVALLGAMFVEVLGRWLDSTAEWTFVEDDLITVAELVSTAFALRGQTEFVWAHARETAIKACDDALTFGA